MHINIIKMTLPKNPAGILHYIFEHNTVTYENLFAFGIILIVFSVKLGGHTPLVSVPHIKMNLLFAQRHFLHMAVLSYFLMVNNLVLK